MNPEKNDEDLGGQKRKPKVGDKVRVKATCEIHIVLKDDGNVFPLRKEYLLNDGNWYKANEIETIEPIMEEKQMELKRIIVGFEEPTIQYKDIDTDKTIFAMKDGRLVGVVYLDNLEGFSLVIGQKKVLIDSGSNLENYLKRCEKRGYEFFQ